MTNRVDRLSARGLVERYPDPDDRRGVHRAADRRGQGRPSTRAFAALLDAERALLADLPERDRTRSPPSSAPSWPPSPTRQRVDAARALTRHEVHAYDAESAHSAESPVDADSRATRATSAASSHSSSSASRSAASSVSARDSSVSRSWSDGVREHLGVQLGLADRRPARAASRPGPASCAPPAPPRCLPGPRAEVGARADSSGTSPDVLGGRVSCLWRPRSADSAAPRYSSTPPGSIEIWPSSSRPRPSR